MAKRSPVPKFGNWENEENVPYTVYFEKARKGKTGTKSSPNTSEESPKGPNPKPVIRDSSFHIRSTGRQREQEETVMSKHGHEGASIRHESGACRVGAAGSPVSSCGGGRRTTPQRAASLQIRNQAKNGCKCDGISYLSPEGIHGELAQMTPGRSRQRSINRGDDTANQGAAVPRFGDWDETDPASADGYTHIFNKVREERQGGKAKVPIQRTQTYCSKDHKQKGDQNSIKICCCFPWGRS